MLQRAIPVVALALLAGCGPARREARHASGAAPEVIGVPAGQIEYGRSTPADVLALLGEPDSRMDDAQGLEQWVYWSTEEVGGRYAHTRIVVEFGADGTVCRVASAQVAP